MKIIRRLLYLSLIFFVFSSCERATEGSSTVSLNLGGGQTALHSNVSSFACTKCLKAVFVNVDADDIKTIVFNQKNDDFKQAGTEISPEVVLEVPSGSKRRFQVMALYLENNKLYIHYGSVTLDLFTVEPPPVTLSLPNLGEFKGGHIVGRYITDFNAVTSKDNGPTGIVNVSIVHAASGAELQFEKAEIVKGWFNFFASENFLMKYVMLDGTVLFGGPVNLASFTTANNISRLYRSTNYYRKSGGAWGANAEYEGEYNDIVYGYFGPAALVSTKKVCYQGESTAVNFFNLADTNSGTPPLTYSTQASADVSPVGGFNSISNGSECPLSEVLNNNRYTAEKIYVSKSQLDGNGNDHAKAIQGAFTYVSTSASGDISKSTYSAQVVALKAVPDVLGNGALDLFDSVRVFKKAVTSNMGFDYIRCTMESISSAGFTEALGLTKTTITDGVSFSTTGVITSGDGLFVCPVRNSNLLGVGGIYLGTVGYGFLSASTSLTFSGVSSQTATITNVGNISVSFTAAITSNTNTFSYLGGAYPGTGGTCTNILDPGNNCTIVVRYSAAAGDTGNLILSYQSNGSTAASTDTSLSGTP